MTGKRLSESFGKWHFWSMLIGFNLTFGPMHWLGLNGMPRRIATYAEGMGWETSNAIATFGSMLIAISVLIYGRVASDHGAITLSIFMGIGMIVWLGLALLYDQQRRERIEALEAEALSADSSASSAFESSAPWHSQNPGGLSQSDPRSQRISALQPYTPASGSGDSDPESIRR